MHLLSRVAYLQSRQTRPFQKFDGLIMEFLSLIVGDGDGTAQGLRSLFSPSWGGFKSRRSQKLFQIQVVERSNEKEKVMRSTMRFYAIAISYY